MDNLNNRPKSKKLLKSVLIIFLSCVVLVGLFWGWTVYDQWRGQKKIQEIAEGMQKAKDEWYKMQMADIYGGKTPQETLNMYIDAVEKGDYELASKYFVIEKQEEELEVLKNSQSSNVEEVLSLLKLTVASTGSFSSDKTGYVIRKPLLVDFQLYPNNIWKIIEI